MNVNNNVSSNWGNFQHGGMDQLLMEYTGPFWAVSVNKGWNAITIVFLNNIMKKFTQIPSLKSSIDLSMIRHSNVGNRLLYVYESVVRQIIGDKYLLEGQEKLIDAHDYLYDGLDVIGDKKPVFNTSLYSFKDSLYNPALLGIIATYNKDRNFDHFIEVFAQNRLGFFSEEIMGDFRLDVNTCLNIAKIRAISFRSVQKIEEITIKALKKTAQTETAISKETAQPDFTAHYLETSLRASALRELLNKKQKIFNGIVRIEAGVYKYYKHLKLTQIPEEIKLFKNLKKLNLPNHQIEEISEAITSHPSLQEVNLKNNQITHLPRNFSKVALNCKFSLEGNPLKGPDLFRYRFLAKVNAIAKAILLVAAFTAGCILGSILFKIPSPIKNKFLCTLIGIIWLKANLSDYRSYHPRIRQINDTINQPFVRVLNWVLGT
jgi:Leucine-rich repeat (LRR) protein